MLVLAGEVSGWTRGRKKKANKAQALLVHSPFHVDTLLPEHRGKQWLLLLILLSLESKIKNQDKIKSGQMTSRLELI